MAPSLPYDFFFSIRKNVNVRVQFFYANEHFSSYRSNIHLNWGKSDVKKCKQGQEEQHRSWEHLWGHAEGTGIPWFF